VAAFLYSLNDPSTTLLLAAYARRLALPMARWSVRVEGTKDSLSPVEEKCLFVPGTFSVFPLLVRRVRSAAARLLGQRSDRGFRDRLGQCTVGGRCHGRVHPACRGSSRAAATSTSPGAGALKIALFRLSPKT
jgi:hypothetical protein